MTHQKITVEGFSEAENGLVNRLLSKLDEHYERNLLRASYYDGKRAIRQVGTVIPPQYYKLGIVLGWSAKAVDVLNRRCNLDGFVWPDGEIESIGYSDIVEDNNLLSELSSAGVESLIHGPSFLVNTQGLPGEPRSLIHVRNALDATGTWNPRSRTLDDFISITGRDDDGPTDFVLYVPGRTLSIVKRQGRWVVVADSSHPWGVPVEPMVYKPRVGRPFGSSRISRPVMSLHDQALRTVIRMEGHADIYSYPEMWMLGADESVFKNADGSQKAAWQVMLGRIKGLPDDDDADNPRADVKQFAASSPEPHIAQLKQQAQLFSGETSIPLTSLGVSDMSNPTSADSYIASREDLIAEAEGATDDWSPALRRCLVRALAIHNRRDEPDPEWRSIEPKWRSPLYLSRAAAADAGAKQLGAGPEWLRDTEVGLKLLGLNDQDIRLALAERRRQVGRQVLASVIGDDDDAA